MSNRDRLALFPSRANLVFIKQRILAAVKGLNLLKRKRDALEQRLREIRVELRKRRHMVNLVMQEAIFSIAKAKYLGTDFMPATVMSVERADIYLRVKTNKIAGVPLPTFELVTRRPTCFPMTGLSRGGGQVELIREKFKVAVETLVAVASLQYSEKVLQEGVRQNNMRINGLEYVIIPRFQNTIAYIRDELDEYEREDFYRLKRSQAKQKQVKERFRKQMQLRNQPEVDEPEPPPDDSQPLIPLPEVVDEKFDMRNFNSDDGGSEVSSMAVGAPVEPEQAFAVPEPAEEGTPQEQAVEDEEQAVENQEQDGEAGSN